MSSRLRYIVRRLGQIPRTLATPIGAVVVVAVVASVVAVAATGSVSSASFLIAILTWGLALLMLADRVRILTKAEKESPSQPSVSESEVRYVASGSGLSTQDKRLRSARLALTTVADSRAMDGADASSTEPAPLVTVVVPNFNDSQYLAECLDSILDQSMGDWECIIVDDASSDESPNVAWECSRADSRMRVVRHTRNVGLSAARNTGLRLASGRFITFLDSDDFLAPDALADRIAHLLPHLDSSDVAGAYCGVSLAPDDAALADYGVPISWSGQQVDFINDGDRCPFNAHAPLIKTSVMKAAGGFDEAMTHGAEDWELWYRLMRSGYRFVPSSTRSAIYRQKPRSMKQTSASQHFREAMALTHSAYMEADRSKLVPGAQTPMLQPRQYYLEQTALLRRAMQSAATAYMAGDPEGGLTDLRGMGPVHPFVLDAASPQRAVNDGIRRFLGLMPDEFRLIQGPLSGDRDAILDLIESSIEIAEPEPVPALVQSFDVLLLPQNGYQAKAMIRMVGPLDVAVGIVDASSVSGDQGASTVIRREASDTHRVLSFNEVMLSGVSARTVVIGEPCGSALQELAAHVSTSTTQLFLMKDPLDDVIRLDCASSIAPDASAPASKLADLVAQTVGSHSDATHETDHVRVELQRPQAVSSLATWAIEEYPETVADGDQIAGFKDRHAGETVVIIGNGPSLNETDLSLLNSVATIGVNGIFYADERLPRPLTYYVVEDSMVVQDNLERVKTYRAGHRFFPSIYRDLIGDTPDTTYFRMNRAFYAEESPEFCTPRFSLDPVQRVYAGQSVTIINLQLAYYMGFSRVVLIGMDFSYQVPASSEVRGALITSQGDDPNHFHPDYFGKGKVWKDPKLDRVLANYALAKQMFEADGRLIVNASVGGNLHLFERMDLAEAVRA